MTKTGELVLYRTFVYRLYPTAAQRRRMLQTIEVCRAFYNECLEERRVAWDRERRRISRFDQIRRVRVVRATSPATAAVPAHVLHAVVDDVEHSFNGFVERLASRRQAGMPRFRGPGRYRSFGYKQYRCAFRIDGRRLYLLRIGRIPVRWHRPISEPDIKTVRIVEKPSGWFACFVVRVRATSLPKTGRDGAFDLGLKSLLVGADGFCVQNPHWYRDEAARTRRLHRRVSRRVAQGRNRAKAVKLLARHTERIRRRRRDFIHKLCSDLVARYDRIAIEDLRIRNMVRNRYLAKSIFDAGWGIFRRQLLDKAEWAGRQVAVVEPAGSSRRCSQCQILLESLTLADRWIECICGLSVDRDVNAARNLLALGRRVWGETLPGGRACPQEAAREYRCRASRRSA